MQKAGTVARIRPEVRRLGPFRLFMLISVSFYAILTAENEKPGGHGMKKILFLLLKIAGIAAALILLFYLGLLITAWI